MEYEYKVIDVADGAISSLLLGEGRIETNVLQAYINAMAAEGWRLVNGVGFPYRFGGGELGAR
jgi:hypothetical protein